MTDDDAPTPQHQPVPKIDLSQSNDPAVYLQRPSPAGHVLGEQVGLHNGAAVPWWMFAETALRLERVCAWIAARSRLERRVRRAAIAGLATLAANVALIVGFAYHRAETSGAEREHAANVDRQILKIEAELGELRGIIWKRFGLTPDPKDVGIVLGSVLPFDLHIDDRIVPMGCGSPCTTSGQCDELSNCRNCYLGKCSAVLPADPLRDAGVDAPAPTKP